MFLCLTLKNTFLFEIIIVYNAAVYGGETNTRSIETWWKRKGIFMYEMAQISRNCGELFDKFYLPKLF